jgi:hypothetical protein
MQPPERRRFHLSDSIALVASAALVFSAHRTIDWLWTSFVPDASYGPGETRRMAWSLALASISLPLLISLLIRDRTRLCQGAAGPFVHLADMSVLSVRNAGWAAQAALGTLFEGRPGFYSSVGAVQVARPCRAPSSFERSSLPGYDAARS